MIRSVLLVFALAAMPLCAVMPAHADARLVSVEYDADRVVRIDGRLGVQATIGFDESELIENVAVGDSAKWQITPNKRANLLFVKPLEAAARTNMTVVTSRHTYFFDLVASPKAQPVYLLRFTYRDEDKAPDPALATGDPVPLSEAEQAALSGDPMAKPADPAELNFSWNRKGDAELMPARVYDDGKATYLVWERQASVPAILIRNEKGEEGPVNYAVRGDTIVIDDVPGQIVLRSGKASAVLEHPSGGGKSASSIFASPIDMHPALAPDLPALARAGAATPAA